MAYQGDIKAARVLRFTFSTVNTSGAPTQLAGTPAISVYKDASTTQSTTGVTLTVDYDTVTGLNHVAIDTSADGTFYSAGSDFAVVITTGTVGGTSVVGYTVGTFSIENRVINWAQIGSPTTTVALTGTTIATTQKVDVETIKTNPVVNAGTITFPTTATLASTTNITAGTVTTATNVTTLNGIAANVITAASIADGAIDAATFAADVDAEILSYIVDDATRIDASSLNTATVTTVPAIEADTQDIQSRLPAALTGAGNIKADAIAIDGSTTAATNQKRAALALARATVGLASTTTNIVTSAVSPAVSVADQYKGRIVIFDSDTTTAALRNQATDITAVSAGGELTVTALTTAPASGDTFGIY